MAEDDVIDDELDEDLDEELEDDVDVIDPDLVEDDLALPAVDEDAVEVVDDSEEEASEEPATAARPRTEDDDEEEDIDTDDVEEDLDTILRDRIAASDDEDEDDEDAPAAPAPRGPDGTRVQPKKPGEFVCQSCFLVKHPSQLADPDLMYCSDCV